MHAAGFRHIRTFGLDNGLNRIAPLAQRHYPDLRLFLGVYECAQDHDDVRMPHSTRAQLDEALRLAHAHRNVAGIVVGNECLPGEPEACPRPVSVDQLIEDLAYVKQRLRAGRRPSVVVTTAMSMVAAVTNYETHGKGVAPHVDVVMVNIHPFFAPAADRGGGQLEFPRLLSSPAAALCAPWKNPRRWRKRLAERRPAERYGRTRTRKPAPIHPGSGPVCPNPRRQRFPFRNV